MNYYFLNQNSEVKNNSKQNMSCCEHDPYCTLCADVYSCTKCATSNYGFNPTDTLKPVYFRFPSIIGCVAPQATQKDILFVGCNPRISNSNRSLHNHLVSNFDNFILLARNQYPLYATGGKYIALGGPEGHYFPHLQIVENIFGKGVPFEKHAAVTEIFLCASQNAQKIYQKMTSCDSPCTNQFLYRVLRMLKPKAIVAVGAGVNEFFATYSTMEKIVIPVLRMQHPNDRYHSSEESQRKLDNLCDELRRIIGL